jgi:pimeloyl-ACP methyl ester carboxylesterase
MAGPLSADDWDTRILFFLNHGYRVIAHDGHGHGRSSETGGGHDMDHYADDLAALTAHLDLKDAVNIGHSTGRRRGGALHCPPRRKPSGKSGDHERGVALDGEDSGQSRVGCPRTCSTGYRSSSRPTDPSFITMWRLPFYSAP